MTIYTPGMGIETETSSEGALGCFARTTGGPLGAGVPVMLSCAHVLFGNAVVRTDLKIRQEGASSTCSKLPIVARTIYSWERGFRRVRINVVGEPNPDRTGYETDCAIARLQPGIQFDNKIPGLNVVIAGTPPDGNFGVAPGPPFSQPPQPEHLVRFYSPVDHQVHWGTIFTRQFTANYVEGGTGPVSPLVWPDSPTFATDKDDDVLPNINQMLVLPRPAPGEGYDPYLRGRRELRFGIRGDSGSVVVNHENQVVGVLIRGLGPKPPSNATAVEWTTAKSIGWVSPIAKVMAQMQIRIQPADSGTVQTAGPITVIGPTAGSPTVHAGMDRFRTEARRSRPGQILLGMMARHAKETRRIVNACRPAIVAWHRNQGPAVVAHLIRALHDPAHEIPVVINGVRREQLLDEMAGLLLRYGGPRLCRDVRRYHEAVLRSAITSETRIDRLPAALATMPRPLIGRAP